MGFRWVFVLLMSLNVSCQSSLFSSDGESKSRELKIKKTEIWVQFENSFFKDLWTLYPGWASAIGLRQYDSQLRVPNQLFFEEQKALLNKYTAQLEQIRPSLLTVSEQVDYRLVQNFLQSALWELNEFKSFRWDPSRYNVGSSLAHILESQQPEKLRAQNISARLQKVPDFYKAAMVNIDKPTREHLNLALQQNKGTVVYLQTTIAPFLKSHGDAAALENLLLAQKAVENFISALETLRQGMQKVNSFKSFRIGSRQYQQKFKLDLQVNASAENIYKFAQQEKEQTLKKMTVIADALWPKYFPKTPKPKLKKERVGRLIQHLSQQHAEADKFIDAVREQIPELWDFVQKKNLMSLDSSKLLKVRYTPEYEQGFAVASIDAPGPFEADKDTFYNVTPLDKMTAEKKDSFLREYNKYTMQILNIHEAIPGHYVQLVYSKKSPSLVKSIFGNGTMVEGWAVYTERMMLENGYGNNEPELWLMYYKWYLRVVCNTIMDYEIHNKNLSRNQALKLLMEDAFQERTEAEMKWERATLSQVQLASYFSGFSEIYRFREELKAKGAFELKEFHEKFLSFGSAPIREIITLMTSPVAAQAE